MEKEIKVAFVGGSTPLQSKVLHDLNVAMAEKQQKAVLIGPDELMKVAKENIVHVDLTRGLLGDIGVNRLENFKIELPGIDLAAALPMGELAMDFRAMAAPTGALKSLLSWVGLSKESLIEQHRQMIRVSYGIPKMPRKMKKRLYGTKDRPTEKRLRLYEMNRLADGKMFETVLDEIMGPSKPKRWSDEKELDGIQIQMEFEKWQERREGGKKMIVLSDENRSTQ